MNNLSWLLYLADVIPSIGLTIHVCTMTAIVALAVYGMAGLIWASTIWSYDDRRTVEMKEEFYDQRKWLPSKQMFALIFGILIIVAIIPSKQTIYLIAASEAGQTVVTSPQANKMLTDIQEIIQLQLDRMKGNIQNGSDTNKSQSD